MNFYKKFFPIFYFLKQNYEIACYVMALFHSNNYCIYSVAGDVRLDLLNAETKVQLII